MKYLKTYDDFLNEKVIYPDFADLENNINLFKKSIESIDNLTDEKVKKKFNSYFRKYEPTLSLSIDKIDIPKDDIAKEYYLLSAESTANSITIFVAPGIFKVFTEFPSGKFKKFVKILINNFIGHEIIHTIQYKKADGKMPKEKYDMEELELKGQDNPKNYKKYLEEPMEIMAWAYDASQELKDKYGIYKALDIIRNANGHKEIDSPALNRYLRFFGNDEKAFKKFLRYVYDYLVEK